MTEILGVLCVLAIVLAIVAIIGHGLWVLVAKIFAFVSGKTPPRSARTPDVCPHCYSPLVGPGQPCAACNWPGLRAAPSPTGAMSALARQVKRLARLGIVSATTEERLLDAIAAERARLSAESTAKPVDEKRGMRTVRAAEHAEGKPIRVTAPRSITPCEDSGRAMSVAVPAPAQNVAARAEQYAASRAAAARAGHADLPPSPPPKWEALSKLLAAFMEEKNIRWGELVGGLLIICCSIALVISFWAEIAASSFLKFFLFGGVTAGLFAAGLYTERRWKLRTTSHGILIIATLLVPLNFLAIAAFTQDSPPTDAIAIGGEVVSIGLFSALIWTAGRVFLPNAPLLLVAGAMIPSVMQLLTRRFVDADSGLSMLYSVAVVPVASYLAIAALYLARLFKAAKPVRQDADRLFTFFGVVTYATLLPLALVLYKTQAIGATLHRLAPLVSLLGLPAVASGLWFWRRVRTSDLVGERTAGISIGVLGAAMMVAAIIFAWPEPAILLPVALLTTAAFAAIAIIFALPAAHAIAGTSFALAWLVTFLFARGDVTWNLAAAAPLVSALLSAASGTALAPLAGLFAVAAYLWQRVGRRSDGAWYYALAVACSAGSLALVTWFGFGVEGDPHGAAWVYAAYAAAGLIAAVRYHQRWLGWTASGLILLAVVQSVVFRWPLPLPLLHVWAVALLAHASIAALLAGVLWMAPDGKRRRLLETLCRSALPTSIAAAVLLTVAARTVGAAQTTPHLFWLSAVWLVLAWLVNWPRVFSAFQVALFASVFSVVTAVVAQRDWYTAAERPWLDPWFLQAQGIAATLLCLTWTGIRYGLRRAMTRAGDSENGPDRMMANWRTTADGLLNPTWPSVDRMGQVVVAVLLLFLATYAAVPGVYQELAPRARVVETGAAPRVVPPVDDFELPDVPHEHAADVGSWTLLAAVVVVLVAGLWEGQVAPRVVGVLLAVAAACPLIAARFEESVAVASALRWSAAAYFLIASVPHWLKQHVHRLAERCRLPVHRRDDWGISPASSYRAVLFGIAVLPYLAMAFYVGVAAVGRAGVPASVSPLLPWLAGAFVVAAILSLSVRRTVAGPIPHWAGPASTTLLVLGGGPLLVAVVFTVAAAIRQHPIVGPEPDTFFRNVGWSVSYAVPVLAMAAMLVVHAIRERSGRIAFAAGLVFNLGATAGFLLLLPQLGRGLDGRAWINVAQVNTIVAATFAVAWTAVLAWYRRKAAEFETTSAPPLLRAQVSLCMGLSAFSILPAAVGLVAAPAPAAWVVEAGGWLSWLGAVLTVAAVAGTARTVDAARYAAAGGVAAVAAPLIALSAARWDTGNWLAYHVLLVSSTAVACGLGALARFVERNSRVRAFLLYGSVAMGAVTILIGLRALAGDPQAPWWTISVLVAMSGLAVWNAVISARRALLFGAAILLNLAGSIWWIDSGYRLTASGGIAAVVDFVNFNLLVAALPVVAWVIVDLRWIRSLLVETPRRDGFAVHAVVSTASVAGVLIMVAMGLASDAGGAQLGESIVLAWLALTATAAAGLACLWCGPSQASLARLYFVTLAVAGQLLNGLDLAGTRFWWMLTMVLAAFSLATSYAWSRRRELHAFAARVGVPVIAQQPPDAATGLAWLVPANSAIAAAVTALAFWMVLSLESFTERMFAAYAIVAQAAAVGLLARGAVRSSLQYASLVLGVLFAVAFGWAWLPAGIDAPLLHRTVMVAVALVATSVLYGFGLVKLLRRENEWTAAAARLVPLLVVAVTATILLVLGTEIAYYAQMGQVPILWQEIVAVSVALGVMCLAALAAAVLPGRDPLGLSERGKQIYVYAAEVAVALLCVHVRLTMPWLFQGWFVRYWPLVVMAIAFAGVGVSEWLARRRANVLSEPLQTTGALLPMLPVLGFWVVPSEVNYSLLLLTVGVLYAALAALRQSFLYGVLAALSANGSLWYLLNGADGLGLAEHPQLWLIPPALCVLLAAYLNRDQLSKEQMTTVRYMSAIVIYVSSTADIFINGVAQAPWLPLVLAGISIAGIFAGILLRVRAFVYLGTSFLIVALFSIIWHAAVELGYAWLWWVCGIVAGMGIIALFAVFEKKRDEMLRLVDRLRAWEP